MNSKSLFLLILSFLVLGAWLNDYGEILPSSRLRKASNSNSLKENHGSNLLSNFVPVYMRTTLYSIIPLPDSKDLSEKENQFWKMANSSGGSSYNSQKGGNLKSNTNTNANSNKLPTFSNTNLCGRLCGRVGMGQCKDSVCVCPLLFKGSFCMSSTKLNTTNVVLSRFKTNYFGDFTVNYRTFVGHKSLNVRFATSSPDNEAEEVIQNRQLSPIPQDFVDILPDRDILHPHTVYDSCAIVGSSSLLLHYSFGEKINGHDFIMRFGDAVTKNYEPYVGNRTNLRVTDSRTWGFAESFSEAVLTQVWDRASLRAMMAFHRRFVKAKLYVLHPHFLSFLVNAFDFFPSLTFQGIMIALHRCASVKLYGVYSGYESNAHAKYYNSCDQSFDPEKDKKEFQIVKALADLKLLSFSEPCIISCRTSKKRCAKCLKRSKFQHLRTYNSGSGTSLNASKSHASCVSANNLRLTFGKKSQLSKWNYILKKSSNHRAVKKRQNSNLNSNLKL